MTIERVVSPLLKSNMFIVREGKRAFIVDPCEWNEMDGDTIFDYIFLTHEHYDHISGVNLFKEKTNAEVVCNAECAENIMNPKRNMSHYFQAFSEIQTWTEEPLTIEVNDYICTADNTFEDDCVISWCGHKIFLFHTPGHSNGSVCIVVDDKYLFSGDSLINGYETTLRFPGGDRRKWEEISLPRLKKLSDQLLVFPGHFDQFYLYEYKW